MRSVLDERLGVPVLLEDDALGLIVVEVNVVLQRACVLSPHDLHGLSGQALELLDLALVKLESSDTLKLTHGSGLAAGTLPRIFVPALGALWTSSVPPSASSRSAIPRSPVPYPVAAGSNPTPSSRTSKTTSPSCCQSRTSTCEAPAYFATLLRASSTQK